MPANNFATTAAIAGATILLGVPIAVGAFMLDRADVPDVFVNSKTIDQGPDGKKTIYYGGFLTGPNDAVKYASFISVATSVIIALGLVLVRHINGKLSSIFGGVVTVVAIVNTLGQVGGVLAWLILHGKDYAEVPEKKDEVKFVDGKYETHGRNFTKEAWACTMDLYFKDKETWAEKACNNITAARYLTIDMVMFAIAIFGIVYWQVFEQGKLGAPSRKRRQRGGFENFRKADETELLERPSHNVDTSYRTHS